MPYFLDQKAINSLDKKLGHTPSGSEQDWELELSDPTRIDEYITLYNQGNLTISERRALIALLLSALDAIFEIALPPEQVLDETRKIICRDHSIYADILEDWVADELDDFDVSPYLRSIMNTILNE